MDRNQDQHVKLIIGSQYFLYFGVLGIFLPYFNLYCYHLGFSGFQIGVLSALRSLALVLFPLFWGALADRLNLRRPIYILCTIGSTSIWVFYLFTAEFWPMLMISLFYGVFYTPIISFLEAFTMDVLGKEKKSYGRIRAWGSMSFIAMVLILGKIIDLYSVDIILKLILAGSILLAFVSVRIPNIKHFATTEKPPILYHHLVEKGKWQPHAASVFKKAGVPFQTASKDKLFYIEGVLDLISFLKVIESSGTYADFEIITHRIYSDIGKKTLNSLKAWGYRNHFKLGEALRHARRIPIPEMSKKNQQLLYDVIIRLDGITVVANRAIVTGTEVFVLRFFIRDKPGATAITSVTLEVISHYCTDKEASHLIGTFRNVPAIIYQILKYHNKVIKRVSNRGRFNRHCHKTTEQLVLVTMLLYLIG